MGSVPLGTEQGKSPLPRPQASLHAVGAAETPNFKTSLLHRLLFPGLANWDGGSSVAVLGIECPTKLRITKHQWLMRGTAPRLSKHCRRSSSAEMQRLYAAFVSCSCCGSRQVSKWGQGCWSRPVEREAQACAKWGRHESWGSGTLLNLQKVLPRTQPNQRLSNWICQKKKKKWRVGETAAKHRGLNSSEFFFFLFPFSPTLTRADKTGQQLVAVSLIHALTSGQAGKWHLEMHTD